MVKKSEDKEAGNIVNEPVKVTDETFEQFIQGNPLVVVDFWAEWCAPCWMVDPIIKELALEYAGKVVFGKLNIDENRVTPSKYGVMAIPTIMFFKNGELVDMVIGAQPKEQLKERVEKFLVT